MKTCSICGEETLYDDETNHYVCNHCNRDGYLARLELERMNKERDMEEYYGCRDH